MCMRIDQKKTALKAQENAQMKECVFFKVFCLDGHRLIPLYQRVVTYDGDVVDKEGFFNARKNPILIALGPRGVEDKGYIESGAYHAYCTQEAATRCTTYLEPCYPSVVVREVQVPVGSILGYGDSGDVAFSRMKICFEDGEHV